MRTGTPYHFLRVEEKLDRKDDEMSLASSQLSGDMTGLYSKLSEQMAEKEKLQEKLDAVEARLVEKERELTAKSGERIENEAKERRALQLRVSDVES